jgi:hypothetical protein
MTQPLLRASERERVRLARATRALAKAERTEFHRGRVLELGAVARRVELLDRIAGLLEDRGQEVTPEGVAAVDRLVRETPRVRDYGAAARERNEHIASVLRELGGAS